MNKYILSIFIFILLCSNSFAKDLFVATDGSDAVTYANNNISNPWLTPLKAWTEADAGDVVNFRTGTYVISSTIDTKAIGNHGTEENPITFQPYSGESVTLDMDGGTGNFRIEKNWNIIDGFTLVDVKGTFLFGDDIDIVGGVVKNCTVVNSFGGTPGANTAFIAAKEIENILIQNNKVKGPGVADANLNGGCLLVFSGASKVKILNNELYDARIGIYWKHGGDVVSDEGSEIAYNYIYETSRFSIELNGEWVHVHDNLIGLSNAKFQINEANGWPNGDNNTINHNTFYGDLNLVLSCDDDGATGNTVTNNLFRINLNSYHQYCATDMDLTSDYNMYKTGDIIINNSINYTLSEWQSFSSLDANSISDDPTFVGGGSPTIISDFALTSESVGYQAGSDGKDIGADTTLVGVDASPPTDPVIITNNSGATVTSTPQTITGTATAPAGETITGVTLPGYTVTPDDGTWDEREESFTVSVNLTTGLNQYTFTATASNANTDQVVHSLTLYSGVSAGSVIGGWSSGAINTNVMVQ